MTDKQPEALRIAAEFESFAIDHAPDGWPAIRQRDLTNASITLRTQHAAIERKDALLRQALGALREYAEYDHCVLLSDAITKELQ